MSDHDLDRMLAAWLGDRPEAAPDRIAEMAMLQIATTPQDRDWLQRFVAWGAQSPGALAATALLVAVVGLGALLLPRLVGDSRPSPTPTPVTTPDSTPATTPDSNALVPFGGENLGYELLLPTGWVESADSPEAGVTTFGSGSGSSTRNRPALTISLGGSDGSLTVCQPVCEQVEVTTLEEIQAELVSVMAAPDPEPPDWPRLVHGDVTLGGEHGRFERPDYLRVGDPEDADLSLPPNRGGNCLGCPDMRYQFYVIHDGRPLLLAFDYWTIEFEAISSDVFRQILESFRFLDADPLESPTPVPEGVELTDFVNQADGYRMRVPATWRSHAERSDGAPPATTFQIPTPSGSAARFAMTVSVGSPDGWITLCAPRCTAFQARSVEDLTPILAPNRGLMPIRDSVVLDIELGGEHGRLEIPSSIALPELCTRDFVYDGYAIHEGRPVVLRISYCVTRPGGTPEPGQPSDLVSQIIESFEFLD